jgi:hypothetical protein
MLFLMNDESHGNKLILKSIDGYVISIHNESNCAK